MNKLFIILDRDGVINVDSPDFIRTPDEWKPIPGSLEKIAEWTQQGHRIVVSTNQSGISRGLFSLSNLVAIHHKMHLACQALGGRLEGIYFCPHQEENLCPCRKPNPGMLWQIAKDFAVNLAREAVVIGDSWRDLEPAAAVGSRRALVLTGNGKETKKNNDLHGIDVFDSLADCTF